jgi:predicted DNA-binding protein YlxM (UPF0122 family)
MVNLKGNDVKKDILFDMYVTKNLPVKEIIEYFNICTVDLYKFLKNFNIVTRKAKMRDIISKNELNDLYINQELSTRDIADIFNVGQTTVRRLLDEYNIPTRSQKEGKNTDIAKKKCSDMNKRTLEIRIPKLIKNIEKVCPQCNNKFVTKPHFNKIYCSKKCYLDSMKLKENKGNNKAKVNCTNCGKEILREQRFLVINKWFWCSKKCEGEWKSKNLVGENSPSYNRISVYCSYCGDEMLIIPSRYYKNEDNYCSHKCMGLHYRTKLLGVNNPHYNGTNRHDYYGIIWHKIRDRIRRRDNYTCQKCGKNENELSYKLVVHHKKSTKHFQTLIKAHKYNNLICLCRECHTWVHSNKNIYNLYKIK